MRYITRTLINPAFVLAALAVCTLAAPLPTPADTTTNASNQGQQIHGPPAPPTLPQAQPPTLPTEPNFGPAGYGQGLQGFGEQAEPEQPPAIPSTPVPYDTESASGIADAKVEEENEKNYEFGPNGARWVAIASKGVDGDADGDGSGLGSRGYAPAPEEWEGQGNADAYGSEQGGSANADGNEVGHVGNGAGDGGDVEADGSA